MKRFALLCALLCVAAFSFEGLADKQDLQTLNGEYYWVGDKSHGDLRAEFTEAGENEWKVAFYFTFDGEAHIYKGTATGSLSEGSLKGKVFNETERRTFTFAGAHEEGTFQGTHWEIRRDKPREMGTLTLSP